MKKILIFFFSIIIFKKSLCSQIIACPYYTYYGQYYLTVFFGSKKINAFHSINLNLTTPWTFLFFYNYLDSKSSQEIADTFLSIIKNEKTPAKEVMDYLSINVLKDKDDKIVDEILSENSVTIKYSFYSTKFKNLPENSNDGLGFSLDIPSKFSIVHQIYDQKLIDRRAFGFDTCNITKFSGKSLIYFGGIPQEITSKIKFKGHCFANKSETCWNCQMPKIHLKKQSSVIHYRFRSENKVFFNSHSENIVFTKDFHNFFVKTLFSTEIRKQLCKVDDLGKMTCKNQDFKRKGNISFFIGDYEVSMEIQTLFYKRGSCNYSYFIRGEKNFIFGTPFISQLYMEFDYDQQRISFYSNKNIIIKSVDSLQGDKNTFIFYLITGNVSLCGVFSLLLLGFKSKLIK